MRHLLNSFGRTARRLLPRLGGEDPIVKYQALAAFVGERAAFVGQTSLYGYLKTRMGTRYPEVFQDPAFETTLSEARSAAFFGCLEDLSIHTAASVRAATNLGREQSSSLAMALFRDAGLHALRDVKVDMAQAMTTFQTRLNTLDWQSAGDPRKTFRTSETVLVAAAPVIDSYREADREIIESSVRYRWIDIRRQLHERLDAQAIVDDFTVLA